MPATSARTRASARSATRPRTRTSATSPRPRSRGGRCSVWARRAPWASHSPPATPSGSAIAAPGGAASGQGGLAFDADRAGAEPGRRLHGARAATPGRPIIRWGDPLFSACRRSTSTHQTAEAQAGQFGYNCDYLDIIADQSGRTGVLVNNHEYVNPGIMFPPTQRRRRTRPSRRASTRRRTDSVVELRRSKLGQPWRVPRRRPPQPPHHRRDGVRAHRACGRQRAREDRRRPRGPVGQGTLGNCAGGTTPWGTVLSGEENFDGYFAWAADTRRAEALPLARRAPVDLRGCRAHRPAVRRPRRRAT